MSSQTTKSKKQSTPAKKTKAVPKSSATKKTSAPAKTAKSTKTTAKTKTVKKAADGIQDATIGTNQVTWSINPKIYPLDVVYQAAFVFIDRAYMLLDVSADGAWQVTLKGKTSLKQKDLTALQGEFFNELLNQAVRKKISKDTKSLRELILAKALFAAARPGELDQIRENVAAPPRQQSEETVRPWDEATQEEQDELDKLLKEIEEDFADDPMGIAVPWDEKYGEDGEKKKEED